MSKMIALVVTLALAGCLVEAGPPGRRTVVREHRESRACPPAYHLEGNACVHNGRARGHYK
jgi:hypothetical protein